MSNAGRTRRGTPQREVLGSAEMLRALHELQLLPGWQAKFQAWARDHPRHPRVAAAARDFLNHLRADSSLSGWIAVHEVYDGRRRLTWTRLAGRPVLAIGVGSSVWQLGPGITPRRRRQRRPHLVNATRAFQSALLGPGPSSTQDASDGYPSGAGGPAFEANIP